MKGAAAAAVVTGTESEVVVLFRDGAIANVMGGVGGSDDAITATHVGIERDAIHTAAVTATLASL